jgi:hypothetical protein
LKQCVSSGLSFSKPFWTFGVVTFICQSFSPKMKICLRLLILCCVMSLACPYRG